MSHSATQRFDAHHSPTEATLSFQPRNKVWRVAQLLARIAAGSNAFDHGMAENGHIEQQDYPERTGISVATER